MSLVRRQHLFSCVWLCSLFAVATLSAQEADSTEVLLQAIAENEALLQKYPDTDFTPNLMFQLVELYVQRARLEYYRKMAEYEELERRYDAGELKEEPQPPQIDFSAALEMGHRLLERYPNAPFRDKVMYRIAVCHLQQGDKDQSIEYLKGLSAETTDRQYLEEAYFRLGEYYFDRKEYEQAITYYRRLLNSWDSPYFDMALYKLGWAYYNVDDFARAISTLIYLIDDVNLLEEVSTEWFGKTNADLRREAIDYVAVSFADFGPPEKARAFFADRKDKDYTEKILFRLAEVYQKRNFYEDAIAALQILLDFYPNHAMAPIIQKQIVENYELAGQKARADEARVRFVAKYGPGSAWFKAIKDDSLRQNTLLVAEEFLYTLGTDAQARAQKENSKLHYGLAISRYQSYLDKFPETERSGKVRFYLAECLFEIGRFDEAAETYQQVVLDYPDFEFRETAAYNRILAYDRALQTNGHVAPTPVVLRDFLGHRSSKIDTIVATNAEQAHVIEALHDFLLNFPASEKRPELLMKLGQELYRLEYYAMAQEVYRAVVDLPAAQRFYAQAYSMIAQCAFKQENFEESERWFRRLSEQFPDSVRFVQKANKMIASSRFKVAENYLEQGDSTRAAQEFERVAGTVSEPDVAERALLEAARLYETVGDKLKAVQVYEAIYRRFPQSERIDKALFKAGFLCEELEDWNRAASNYLTLYQTNPQSPLASKSLFRAARCYENANNPANARRYYDEYTRTYADDPDRYLEAAFRKGEIAYNQGNFRAALKDFELVAAAFKQFTEQNQRVQKYLPANAQFLVGEILFDEFKRVKLKPPLDRALKLKKARFEKVIKAYTAAAKFKVADWTTAASYRIGMTFEEFANTLLDSPRPSNLTGQALVDYNKKLWDNVLPFKQKALKTYQNNVQQAAKNGIDNQWVALSKQRMQSLTIELSVAGRKPATTEGSY